MSATVSASALASLVAEEESAARHRPRELPFEAAEYASRLHRLRGLMAAAEVDVLLLTAPDAMCWLHGYDARWYRSHSGTRFPVSHATIVRVDADTTVHLETAAHENLVRLTSCVDEFVGIPGSDPVHEPTLHNFADALANELTARCRPNAVVGVERWSSVPNPASLDAVTDALTAKGFQVRDATVVVREARRVKSPAEIAIIEQAQTACDAGLRALHHAATPGMTELQAWSTYIAGMVAAGGEPSAMHDTVAAGPPMPFLHGVSTRRALQRGDHFHADVAAATHRYHARGTRMFSLGEPRPELTRMAEIAAGAHDVFTETATAGTPFSDVHRALRDYFAQFDADGWAGGYELGISFPPDWVGEFAWDCLDEDTPDVIEDGLVTNFEVSVFGVAMVDTAIFASTGTRLLSSLPREILVVAEP